MKNIIKTILISFVMLSCNAQDQTIEDKLYSCIEKYYSDYNIDLAESLDSLENYLISKNILYSKDGASKIQFYKNIIKNGKIPGIERIELMDNLAEHYYGNDFVTKCLFEKYDVDSTEYKKSKFYQTSEAIKNEVAKQGLMSATTASEAMLNHLTKEDFENPLYRAHMLISYVMTADFDQAYIRGIPQSPIEAPATDNTGFIIDLSIRNQLFLNGEKFNFKELQTELLKYFSHFDKSTYVRIVSIPQTEYEVFTKIHSEIEMAYEKYWNQIAKKEFNIGFDKLDKTEQNEIKERYPIRIAETLKKN